MGLILVCIGLGKRAGREALRFLKRPAGVGEAVEDFLVQAFVEQAAIEKLNLAVLLRLA